MARCKVKVESVINSWDEVDEVMRNIALAEMEISKIEDDMNKKISKLKEEAAIKAKAWQVAIDASSKDLKDFAELNKDDIQGKTKVLNFGRIGFRKSTKCVCPSKTELLEKVIERLKNKAMTDCVIVKESVNKEALKQYSEDIILAVGAKLKVTDEFWYEVEHEKLESV